MTKSNQKGFGAVEALLILVIVGLIGFTGWFVINSQKETSKTIDQTNKSALVNNQKPAPKTTREYCAPLEKLCFNQPKDWTVSYKTDSVDADFGPPIENAVLSDPAGKNTLKFTSGIMGVGGVCLPEDSSPQTIVEVKKTGLIAKNSDGNDQPLYAVKAVINQGNDFTANAFLTAATDWTKVGTINDCGFGLAYLVPGKNNGITGSNGSVNAGVMTLSISSQKVASFEAAKRLATTTEFNQAFDSIVSVYYK